MGYLHTTSHCVASLRTPSIQPIFIMKSVILRAILLFVLVSVAAARPKSTPDDVVTELLELASSAESGEAHDVMSSEHSSTEKEMEGDGSEGSEESSSFSDMISFNLALLPPQGTFQKRRESLSTVRDQLNSMWHMSAAPAFFADIPDDYMNTTLQNEVVDGSMMTFNETVYKVIGEDGVQSVYHIQVISLHPQDTTDLMEQINQHVSASTVADVEPTTEEPATTNVEKIESFEASVTN